MREVLAAIMGNMVSVNVTTVDNERQSRVNRASMILGIAACIIQILRYSIYI